MPCALLVQGFATIGAFEKYVAKIKTCRHLKELQVHAQWTRRVLVTVHGEKDVLESSASLMATYSDGTVQYVYGKPVLASFGEARFGWAGSLYGIPRLTRLP